MMKDLKVPGASFAFVKDAKLHTRGTFGVADRETNRPVDNETVFEAGSVSKTVFAYVALKLCEKGVIGLDAPLSQYTAKLFLDGEPRLNLITTRRVLSHTTGLPNWRSAETPLRLNFTPGEKYSYSGEGYYYLQSVITQLTGHTNRNNCARFEQGLEVCATNIDEYLEVNLLTPFGMTSSGYVWNDKFEKQAARPHDPEGKPLPRNKGTATAAARYAAAGNLLTTPTDYAKFLIEILKPKRADAQRMSAASLREMVRPQVKVDETSSWALGWQVRHTARGNIIQHGGDNTGFHAFAFASVARKSGLIVMTNGENGWKIFFEPAFVELITRLLLDA